MPIDTHIIKSVRCPDEHESSIAVRIDKKRVYVCPVCGQGALDAKEVYGSIERVCRIAVNKIVIDVPHSKE